MAIFGALAANEAKLRRQSVSDAEAMFREHGAAAVPLLTARLIDTGLSADDRRLCRLTRLEVERLMRTDRQRRGTTAMVVYQPRGFTLSTLAKLFGFGKKRRRR